MSRNLSNFYTKLSNYLSSVQNTINLNKPEQKSEQFSFYAEQLPEQLSKIFSVTSILSKNLSNFNFKLSNYPSRFQNIRLEPVWSWENFYIRAMYQVSIHLGPCWHRRHISETSCQNGAKYACRNGSDSCYRVDCILNWLFEMFVKTSAIISNF